MKDWESLLWPAVRSGCPRQSHERRKLRVPHVSVGNESYISMGGLTCSVWSECFNWLYLSKSADGKFMCLYVHLSLIFISPSLYTVILCARHLQVVWQSFTNCSPYGTFTNPDMGFLGRGAFELRQHLLGKTFKFLIICCEISNPLSSIELV